MWSIRQTRIQKGEWLSKLLWAWFLFSYRPFMAQNLGYKVRKQQSMWDHDLVHSEHLGLCFLELREAFLVATSNMQWWAYHVSGEKAWNPAGLPVQYSGLIVMVPKSLRGEENPNAGINPFIVKVKIWRQLSFNTNFPFILIIIF